MILNKIAAISDVHIFNNKRFNEHNRIFKLLDEDLNKQKPELILILGDVIDSKNKLSPEQIVLVRDFFKMLSNHARVAFIIGNHDRSLQTDNRLDSLSTIVNTIENPKNEIIFLQNSEVYDLGYQNCKFAVWSWIENNKKPKINKQVNDYIIGLYHGVIEGAVTKDGHKLSGGIKLSEFDECDIVIAGDIHNKTSFRNGEISYVSSLLQVSIKEDAHGSYSIYDWNGKTFNMSRQIIHNEDAIETIHINDYDKLDTINVKNIRLKYDTDEINRKNVKEIAKKISKDLNVKVTTFPVIKKKKNFIVEKDKNEEIELVNYFDDFLQVNKDRIGISESDFEQLKEINNNYKSERELDFELGDFNIRNIKISNLLTYPTDETIIEFDKEGLIGILGKNRAGKSSIIKIIQFVLFGELPANSVLYSFLNKNNRKTNGYAEIILEKNGKLYKINRGIKPKTKKKADSNISFVEISDEGDIITDLNKSTKTETEKEIRKYLGLNDYFEILSIFSAQKKQVEFIDCKNAERLSLLNKFLNLQEYEEKENLVKEDIKLKSEKLKTLLYQYESYFKADILENDINETKTIVDENKSKISTLEEQIDIIVPLVEQYKLNYYNNLEMSKKEGDIDELIQKLDNNKKQITENGVKISKLDKDKVIKDIELDMCKQEYELLSCEIEKEKEDYKKTHTLTRFELYQKNIDYLNRDIWETTQNISKCNKQLQNKNCEVCNAPISEEIINNITSENKQLNENLNNLNKELLKQNEGNIKIKQVYDDIISKIGIVNEVKEKMLFIEKTINNIQNNINDLKLQNSLLENKNFVIEQNIKEVELIINAKKIVEQYKPLFEETNTQLTVLQTNYQKTNELIKVSEQKIRDLEQKLIESYKLKKQIDNNEKEISLLKTYRDIVSKKGLPLYVLNLNIEAINNKINAIVSQIFDFELIFEINEEKGEATINFIYPDDEESNEVTMASGSETFLINLCIKVGLSQISKLPKINTLFIDEGYDVLDSESISKLPNLFEVLKNYYENIYTITHLDEIKMILDHQIILHKKNGYTYFQ